MKTLNAQKVSLYGFFTATALLFGYVEYLVPLNFIAPGVKLGFANGVFLLLLFSEKYKVAFVVNLVRILLSTLLFGTPFSLLFSLTAGVSSMALMTLFYRFKKFGFIGISALGAVVHNATQLIVAAITVGQGVWYYLPFLLIAGVIAGIGVGIITFFIYSRIYKTKLFVSL